MHPVNALLHKTLSQGKGFWRGFRRESAFKVLFVFGFACAFEIALAWIFHDGLRFLKALGGTGIIIIERLFALFFLAMGFMLVVSSVVASYATVFRSREIPYLLVRPFPFSVVVMYKFLESSVLSSWAFLFIIAPFIAAYAVLQNLSLGFALGTLVFSAPFLLLCSAIGTLFSLLSTRWFPRFSPWKAAAGLLLCAALILAWTILRRTGARDAGFSLIAMVPGLRLANHPIMPSWWLTEGILSLERGRLSRALLFWCVLSSTAAMACSAVDTLGKRTFYAAWQRVDGRSGQVRRSPLLLPRTLRVLKGLPADVRAMLAKDIRIFLRDPMQWSQALIFFGLLALYFSNLRGFRYHLLPAAWQNVIVFLNVFSVSAVLCSLGSRFVYPQLSLEGQGFWILGLAPTGMRRILLTKFFAACAAMGSVSLVLMALSTAMLRAPVAMRVLGLALVACISAAVSGLSCGLGALFIDLKERNPAAIVSGFGGTLNLVLSLAFLLLVILPFGYLFHGQALGRLSAAAVRHGAVLASLWLCVLSIVSTVVPLVLGGRALVKKEF